MAPSRKTSVLDVEHERLRHAGAVRQQRLQDPTEVSAANSSGAELRRVDRGTIESELRDDRLDVDVGGQSAEIAKRSDLAVHVVRRGRRPSSEEGETFGLGSGAR